MTALTGAARLDGTTRLRALPWRRMAWVTWRQHRYALAAVVVFAGGLAVWLWMAGVQLHHAHSAAMSCHPATSAACAHLIERFNFMNHALVGGYALQPVPALIGAFVGAPVLARELETGTFRYAWTQGFGRWRWTLAKLVCLAVVLVAVAAGLSVLISWYYQPYLATANQSLTLNESSPLSPALFDLRGLAFAGWTLLAFAIGGLAGMVIRRVVPAIVATLAIYTGIALAAGNVLVLHYLPPVVTSSQTVPGSAWVFSQWWTHGGRFAFTGQPPNELLARLCRSTAPGPLGKPTNQSIFHCLSLHGFTTWTRLQPASRFWTFQWIQGGWLLVLSALLIAATVWLVRRRAA